MDIQHGFGIGKFHDFGDTGIAIDDTGTESFAVFQFYHIAQLQKTPVGYFYPTRRDKISLFKQKEIHFTV
jgi:hypothetical protein